MCATSTSGLTAWKPCCGKRLNRPTVGLLAGGRYAGRVFPWILFALVAVPLVVVGFVATRRRTAAGEHPASEDAQERALTEQEFADAEAYEAKWHEEDKKRYHQERLP